MVKQPSISPLYIIDRDDIDRDGTNAHVGIKDMSMEWSENMDILIIYI